MKYLVGEVPHYGLTKKYGSPAFKIGDTLNAILTLQPNGWTKQHEARSYSYYIPSYRNFEKQPLVLIPIPHQKDLEQIAFDITNNKRNSGLTTYDNSGHNHQWLYVNNSNLVYIKTCGTGSSEYVFCFEWDQQNNFSFLLENPYPDFIIDLPADCNIAKKREHFWDLDIDIHQAAQQGLTLLHKAASSLSRAGVQELLKSGVDPNVKDSNGQTPLILAAKAINSKVERSNRECYFYDSEKITQENAADVFRHLLKFGANVNIQDNFGRTVLHYLALQSNIIFVNVLLKKSKKLVTIADNQGKLPLDLALNTGHHKVVEQLRGTSLVGTIVEHRLLRSTIWGTVVKESRDYVWIEELDKMTVSGNIQNGKAVPIEPNPKNSSRKTIIRLKKMDDGTFTQESRYKWSIWDGTPRSYWTD